MEKYYKNLIVEISLLCSLETQFGLVRLLPTRIRCIMSPVIFLNVFHVQLPGAFLSSGLEFQEDPGLWWAGWAFLHMAVMSPPTLCMGLDFRWQGRCKCFFSSQKAMQIKIWLLHDWHVLLLLSDSTSMALLNITAWISLEDPGPWWVESASWHYHIHHAWAVMGLWWDCDGTVMNNILYHKKFGLWWGQDVRHQP